MMKFIAVLFALTILAQINNAQNDINKTSTDKPLIISAYPPKKDTENAEAVKFRNLGIEYTIKGDFKNAIDSLTKSIELDPKFADAYNRRGVAYSGNKDSVLAIDDFTKALELNPKFDLALLNRGSEYMLKKKYKSAISDFTKGIELDSENFLFYTVRADAYEKIGRRDLATKDQKKFQELLSKP